MLELVMRARVVRERVVLEIEGEPPVVIGRLATCPCCGEKVFVEAPCPS